MDEREITQNVADVVRWLGVAQEASPLSASVRVLQQLTFEEQTKRRGKR